MLKLILIILWASSENQYFSIWVKLKLARSKQRAFVCCRSLKLHFNGSITYIIPLSWDKGQRVVSEPPLPKGWLQGVPPPSSQKVILNPYFIARRFPLFRSRTGDVVHLEKHLIEKDPSVPAITLRALAEGVSALCRWRGGRGCTVSQLSAVYY